MKTRNLNLDGFIKASVCHQSHRIGRNISFQGAEITELFGTTVLVGPTKNILSIIIRFGNKWPTTGDSLAIGKQLFESDHTGGFSTSHGSLFFLRFAAEYPIAERIER